jgi:hypothetical protein
LHTGFSEAAQADSAQDIVVSGLNIGSAGAATVGGVGTILGVAGSAALIGVGAVLGVGVATFQVGRAVAPYAFGDRPYPHLEYDPIGPPRKLNQGETPAEVEPVEGGGPAGAGVGGSEPAMAPQRDPAPADGSWYLQQLDEWEAQQQLMCVDPMYEVCR